MNSTWHFGVSESGEKEGFNASGISIFAGDSVGSITREVIQNSLDARDSKTAPVKVKFDLIDLNAVTAPEIYSLGSWIDQGQAAETGQKMNSKVGTDFYKDAQIALRNIDGLKVLAIHDANTKGLGGPLRTNKNNKDGGWISLVKSAGITNKQGDDALGSFGQGAKAPFAMSGLRTVFYYTKTDEDTPLQSRFQGKSILQSMWLTDTTFTGKAGFFGVMDSDNHCSALVDSEVPDWATASRELFSTSTGTSLFITAPNGTKDIDAFWLDIKIAVLANFYFAISEKNLEVEFGDGHSLTADTLSKVFQALVIDQPEKINKFTEEVQDALESSKTIQVGASDENLNGLLESKTFGAVRWFIRYGEGITRRNVGVARQNGMLITRSAEKLKLFPSFRPFDMFICVVGSEGSQILRSFENPEHNTFQFRRVVDETERARSKKAYETFTSEIRKFLETKVAAEIKSQITTDDLNHLFGGEPSDSDGEKPDEKSNRIVLDKPKKRKFESGERTQVPTDETEGASGVAGGPGQTKQPGGNLPNPDGSGEVPKVSFAGTVVKNLRMSPRDGDGYSRVHFTPTVKGITVLRLFKSGTVDREPIAVQLPNSSAWVTEVRCEASNTSARKALKMKLTDEDLAFSIEAVLL